MDINEALLDSLIDMTDPKNKAVVDVIKPNLPALKKGGGLVVDGFLEALNARDWARIDRDLYTHMTEDERDALSDRVLQDARAAVDREFERARDLKKITMKVAMSLLLALV